jgi:hypothetical protein
MRIPRVPTLLGHIMTSKSLIGHEGLEFQDIWEINGVSDVPLSLAFRSFNAFGAL